ncbi:hypothetical protein [Delftia tsuruhatensis]
MTKQRLIPCALLLLAAAAVPCGAGRQAGSQPCRPSHGQNLG